MCFIPSHSFRFRLVYPVCYRENKSWNQFFPLSTRGAGRSSSNLKATTLPDMELTTRKPDSSSQTLHVTLPVLSPSRVNSGPPLSGARGHPVKFPGGPRSDINCSSGIPIRSNSAFALTVECPPDDSHKTHMRRIGPSKPSRTQVRHRKLIASCYRARCGVAS
jgi:hypothetical protein